LRIDRLHVAAAAATPFLLAGGGPQARWFRAGFDRDGKLTPSAFSDDLRGATNH
jgi:hypothetical protein